MGRSGGGGFGGGGFSGGGFGGGFSGGSLGGGRSAFTAAASARSFSWAAAPIYTPVPHPPIIAITTIPEAGTTVPATTAPAAVTDVVADAPRSF